MLWAQYDLSNGRIVALVKYKIDDATVLPAIGRDQVEVEDDLDINNYRINILTRTLELIDV